MNNIKQEYEFPVYLFHKGENYRAYEFFGVHRIKEDTFAFRVWAPHAQAVSLVGDFNSWDYEANYMLPVAPGIWECITNNVHIYDCYKFAIRTKDGRLLEKADRALQARFTKSASTNGQIKNGLTVRKNKIFLKSLSIFMKFISAHGKDMKTAIFFLTAKWQMSLSLMLRIWDTHTLK